ncbi:MAG: transporter substrate-binding domain-containing protein [Coriobacteriia bacterium]|nr:transporter substrate-binding domain-containing protein [Coriobacteriia bacterium]
MRRIKWGKCITKMFLALVMTSSLVVISGCEGVTGSKDIPLTPVISNPAVSTDGVLRVGVDTTLPPYAGLFDGTIVGVDVDVAAALAEHLGLRLELVDTSGQSLDALLIEGAVDMVMDIEQTGGSVIRGRQIGPYIESGPALFTIVRSSSAPEVDLASLVGTSIAAQRDSLSAWSLEEMIAVGTADPRETLDEAFGALVRGEVTYAAADAVVGSYLALEYDSISCVAMLGTPIGVYIGVAPENIQLADALTQALRDIRDNGVLGTVISKWLGPVSASVVMGSSAITSQDTNGSTAVVDPDAPVDMGEDLPDPSNAG